MKETRAYRVCDGCGAEERLDLPVSDDHRDEWLAGRVDRSRVVKAGCGGKEVSGDMDFCCEACECRVCDECERNCTECNNSYCANCSKVCKGCDSDLCKDCVKKCITCNQDLCPGCLTNERCFNCDEQTENDEEQDATTDSDSHATVHATGLGQAAVSA